jgi:hypothetical protein
VTRWQYHELCRRCIADQFRVDLHQVRPGEIPNPLRQGQPRYRHHIDLLWICENHLERYVHIAAIHWRETGLVALDEVLLLQKRKEKIAAHKGLLITNTGFCSAARAAALDDGVDLFILRPLVDPRDVRPWDAVSFQQKLQELSAKAQPFYSLQRVELRKVP